jgi:nitrite reductase/ring-hydroxylating ferredoxin subunit
VAASEAFDTGLFPGEIDPARPRPIETPWGTMALYRLGGRIVCWQAFCPHLQGPLFQGTLSSLGARHSVTCPWHGWRFDLESGWRLDGPASDPWRRAALVHCEVRASARGTILLHRPAAEPG